MIGDLIFFSCILATAVSLVRLTLQADSALDEMQAIRELLSNPMRTVVFDDAPDMIAMLDDWQAAALRNDLAALDAVEREIDDLGWRAVGEVRV